MISNKISNDVNKNDAEGIMINVVYGGSAGSAVAGSVLRLKGEAFKR